MEESEIFLVIILLVQKQLISIRYLILIFIVVISVLTKGFLSTTLFNKLVCFRFFFVMDDKTYIRLVKIGYRNYSVSPRWYSTPLRVVEYHRLDWIILDIRFYLVEYLFIMWEFQRCMTWSLEIPNRRYISFPRIDIRNMGCTWNSPFDFKPGTVRYLA